MNLDRYAKFSWVVLVYNILVILWGAYVRATGSGAGCGSHWPLCNGEVLPRSPQIETMIEFGHRLSSGLAFILVLILFIWALRTYPKGSHVRFAATFSMVFITTEALVGAGLVLFEWVAYDASVGRAIAIVVHLINTFLLLGALSMTAWWTSGFKPVNYNRGTILSWGLLVGLLGTMVLGASGALTALGDTLFPVTSITEGIQQDFSPTAHFLIRFRLLHPTIAVITGFYLVVISLFIRSRRPDVESQKLAIILVAFVVVQLGAGLINVLLLAPVWMQITHLLLADLIWIALIFLSASTLAKEDITAEKTVPEPKPQSHPIT